MLGNLLAVLKFQLRDSCLFVSTLPVDSSTLGMADHHSRYCWDADSRVVSAGDHIKSFVSSLVVEPSFLARLNQAMWDPSDVEMRKVTWRVRGNLA